MVRYYGQQDASTNKDFMVSQPSMCHNSPQNSHIVKLEVNLRKVNAAQKIQCRAATLKVNAAQLLVNL